MRLWPQVTVYPVWKWARASFPPYLPSLRTKPEAKPCSKNDSHAAPMNTLVPMLACQENWICPPKYNHQQPDMTEIWLIRQVPFVLSPLFPQQNCPQASEPGMCCMFSICLSKGRLCSPLQTPGCHLIMSSDCTEDPDGAEPGNKVAGGRGSEDPAASPTGQPRTLWPRFIVRVQWWLPAEELCLSKEPNWGEENTHSSS